MPSGFVRFLKGVQLRLHALVVLAIVGWATYAAVSYLIISVFLPTHVPPAFLEWQANLDADALYAQGVPGVSSPAPRAPIGHYHGVDRWFQADPYSGCTISDCHSPLSHTKTVAVRAFANLHATFLACQMCHQPAETMPTPARWVNTATGQAQQAPPVLQLYKRLDQDKKKIKEDPPGSHTIIVELLKESLKVIGGDPLLDYLLLQLETSEPGSPAWRHAITQLTAELPLHLRGEYGAKLAPQNVADNYRQIGKRLAKQAKQYLATSPDSTEREQLHEQIHGSLLAEANTCLVCHGGDTPLLDFESLGYWPRRVATLQSTPLASQMQKIMQGQEFYLPQILKKGGDEQ